MLCGAQVEEDCAVKPIENLRGVDDDVDRLSIFDAIQKVLEKSHMLDVERAVRHEVREAGAAIGLQAALDGAGNFMRQRGR